MSAHAHGIFPNEPEHTYHRDDAVSQSSLKTLLRSPKTYCWEQNHPREQTPSMALGSLVHALVLDQPHNYVPMLNDARTKAGKEERAALVEDDKAPVSIADWNKAADIRDAVLANPEARELIESTPPEYRECSMWWRDDEAGIECRGRIDALSPLGPIDLKTTRKADPRGFAYSCRDFGYHIQAAFYGDGLAALGHEMPPMTFIAVETEPPYLVAVRVMSQTFIDAGRDDYRRALALLGECRSTDTWPDFPGTETTIYAPWENR